MTTETLKATLKTVGALFNEVDAKYTIPIFQRNYAWGAEQIEQLISDVRDAMEDGDDDYFLGNLIVTERGSKAIDYEVIDGQQRLTTLYLLLTYLQKSGQAVPDSHRDRLRYQSRLRSTGALRRISSNGSMHSGPATDATHDEDQTIHQGFNIIRQFMEGQKFQDVKKVRFADYLQNRVTVVRAVLPKRTDLNRYFEIMNTRGQQLQQVDIVKARLMALIDSGAEQACFAWIWEACADMDSYVQMSLTRGDTEARKALFDDDWAWLRVSSFDELMAAHVKFVNQAKETNTDDFGNSLTLDGALEKYTTAGVASPSEDLENVRFRSTIEFPAFLLHVLKVWQGDESADERGLDDKKLIERFKRQFDRSTPEGSTIRGKVREFLLLLLRCRNYFDAYVLKRQFTAANGDDGDWSLQRLVKGKVRPGSNTASPRYINTATSAAVDAEDDGEVDRATHDLLQIESMLRVTYTSPRTMHWITIVLRIVNKCGPEESVVPLRDNLRSYAREQVRRQLSETGDPAGGFGISRIVFTYVDYLLASEAPNRDFRFQFRNSIEHFYPQSPDQELQSAYGALEDPSDLDLFGNLALVTVRDNSKFTNSPPVMKAGYSKIVAQSPKLGKMAEIAQADKCAWNSLAIKTHHTAMVDLLRLDLGIS
jgi:hypothetical protein